MNQPEFDCRSEICSLVSHVLLPAAVSCLKGCIFSSQGSNNLASYVVTDATCVKASKQYDYSTFKPTFGAVAAAASGSSGGRKMLTA